MAKNRILSSEDGATKEEFSWGEIRWLYGQYFDDEGEMTFGVVKMKPGEENALHSHPNCEEILYLIQGEVEHLYEGRSFQLSPGMAYWQGGGTGNYCVLNTCANDRDRRCNYRRD